MRKHLLLILFSLILLRNVDVIVKFVFHLIYVFMGKFVYCM